VRRAEKRAEQLQCYGKGEEGKGEVAPGAREGKVDAPSAKTRKKAASTKRKNAEALAGDRRSRGFLWSLPEKRLSPPKKGGMPLMEEKSESKGGDPKPITADKGAKKMILLPEK